MLAIHTTNLSRSFNIPIKEPGLKGAVKALFKPQYRIVHALKELNLSVEQGEMIGYIGVNGAGKSTTIKMLSGLMSPSSGQVRILGRDPMRERIANTRDVGAVFGQRTQLWWDIAFEESLNLIADINDIPTAQFKRTLSEFIEVLDLQDLLRKPVRTMSLGQKMRAELAAALIHDPKVVYLDEPTIGLDVVVKQNIRDFIKLRNQAQGLTAVLTTHDLADIEQLCSRVVIIDAGKQIFDGSIDTLKQQLGRYRYIKFDLASVAPAIDWPQGCESTQPEAGQLHIKFDRQLFSANDIIKMAIDRLDIKDFAVEEPSLEAIITQIYKGANPNDAT